MRPGRPFPRLSVGFFCRIGIYRMDKAAFRTCLELATRLPPRGLTGLLLCVSPGQRKALRIRESPEFFPLSLTAQIPVRFDHFRWGEFMKEKALVIPRFAPQNAGTSSTAPSRSSKPGRRPVTVTQIFRKSGEIATPFSRALPKARPSASRTRRTATTVPV